METKLLHWRKLAGHKVRLPIEEEIRQAIIREYAGGYRLKACIGTDSQVKGRSIECATVIVLLREGRWLHVYSQGNTGEIHEHQRKNVA